jgi:hypothetical protein
MVPLNPTSAVHRLYHPFWQITNECTDRVKYLTDFMVSCYERQLNSLIFICASNSKNKYNAEKYQHPNLIT